MARLAQLVAREGGFALARRKASQAAGWIAERSSIRRQARHPWQPDDRPVFLFVTHRCGGGTERHVRELGIALRREGIRPLLVRPSRPGRLLWEESDDDGRCIWCRESTDARETIGRELMLLRPAHVHVHHLMGVPEILMDVVAEHGIAYDWTVHDYYPICPRVNLIGTAGIYCGEPDAPTCNRCLASLGDDQGRPVDETITSWRERIGRRVVDARRVFVPSEDARRRLERHFDSAPLRVRPHSEALPVRETLAAPLRSGETVRVAVVGTITALKGSPVLEACARDARRRGLPLEFRVIGSTDRDAVLTRLGNVRITGRYRDQQAFEHLSLERPHLAFLPSLCPETFMYTLSILMAARLFVICFDLGAQAERVRAWGWGQVLPAGTRPDSINDALLAAARSLADGSPAPPAPQPAAYPTVLTAYYDFTADELERMRGSTYRHDKWSENEPRNVRRRDHAHLY
jgi:glycosyltransferase involved in cell wall biosynthesis